MAVEFIIGRAGSGKTFFCLNRMKKILDTAPLDTKIIFLLPAYQTYRAELELTKITGGSVNTGMYSFQRFARQILSEVGGAILPRISETGQRLLLRKILLNHVKVDDLKFYNRAARQRGFAENLSQELLEFRTYAIDAEKILSAAEKISDADLSNKLHDLAIFSADFKKAIADKQNDESDLLEKSAALIKDSVSIKSAEIFIDGFIFFDPQQRKFLQELFQHAKNIHVVLPMNCDLNSRENISHFGIFNRAFETFKLLKNMATDSGVEFEIVRCETPKRFESPELEFIEQNFFKKTFRPAATSTANLKIVEAVNKRVEVEAVARDILRLRREKNFSFRDIGIISRDDGYGDLIKPIFEMHNIPFFADNKKAANHHPLAELIRSVPEILRGFRADSIFRCLRTGFFEVAAADIDLLENYVIEFGLRGENIWTQEENWTWHRHPVEKNPDEVQPKDFELARMEKVDDLRRNLIAPIIKFSQAVKKKKSARILTEELYNLLENLKVHEKLVAWSEVEELRGNLSLSREHLKIWDDVIILFEQIVESLDEESIGAKEFEAILNEGLDALEMSLIPPGLDEVTISKFDQNSLQNSKAIYILGFNENFFPKQAAEKNLLSDADRLHLIEDCEIEIAKGGRETVLAEKFLVYRGLTLAKNFLHISYTMADAEGKAARPSTMLDKLKKFFPDLKVETVNLEVLNSLGTEVEYSIGSRKISADSAKKLFAPHKKMSATVTRLEEFNKCPFKYFANYGLNLKERREYKVLPPDIGDILHSVLRQFGENLKAENRRWALVDDAELERRVTKIVDELTANLNNKILLGTNSGKRQRERIKKVAKVSLKRLIELDRVSKFHPELFEKKFSDLQQKSLVYDIDGVKVELKGTIDRTDFSEDGKYFLIIDYKTGKAYLNLAEIFIGVNLQLLTYLMVTDKLETVGERLPAGMLYYFLKYPAKQAQTSEEADKAVDSEISPKGWLLEDKSIVAQVDGSGKFIKAQFTGKGDFTKTFQKAYLQSAENFDLLIKFADEILRETGKKILQGIITASPFKKSPTNDACKYCDYVELCGFNEKISPARKILLDDNEKIFEKMKNHETGINF